MTITKMDHVSVVVDDLPAAIAFFTTLGMTLEGEMPVEGPSVDRLCGLQGVRADIAMHKYRLCYLRGPAGIIVALAEELS